jgi:hypothetical protein
MKALAPVLAAIALFAGCTSSPSLESASLAPGADAGASTVQIHAEGCTLAGAVAANPGVVADAIPLPKPFQAGDVTWYFDGQTRGDALLVGNYHTALVCAMGMMGERHLHMMGMGFVGLAVKAPRIDGVEPAQHNFLLSTIATSDRDLADAIQKVGFRVYPAQVRISPLESDAASAADAVIETSGDGIYESVVHWQKEHDFQTLRFWMIVEGADGQLHVAHADARMTPRAGARMFTGESFFSHTLTSKHPGGMAYDAAGSLSYVGFDLDLEIAVLPDVADGMWMH